MSDSNQFKKGMEVRDLELFLKQFGHATGFNMEIKEVRERPDFTVTRNGRIYGLELVRVVERPDERHFRSLMGGSDVMSDSDASDAVQMAIYNKEQKRSAPGWSYADSTILIVQLFGPSAQDVYSYWDDEILDELRATGFVEIWLSDHGSVGPYGTVEIVGIKPADWEGVHCHSMRGSKPYG